MTAKCYLILYTWYVIAESKYSGFGCLSEMFKDSSHKNVNCSWLKEVINLLIYRIKLNEIFDFKADLYLVIAIFKLLLYCRLL